MNGNDFGLNDFGLNEKDLQLHFEVMGIALGVLGVAGRCELFGLLEAALDELNMEELEIIRKVFESFPEEVKFNLINGLGTAEEAVDSIELFTQILCDFLFGEHLYV